MVVTLGALLADTPHTRPVPVSGTSSDADLALDARATSRRRYEGPTGIVGVLQDACAAAGIPAVSLWAAVPHYVAQPPSPKATLALLAPDRGPARRARCRSATCPTRRGPGSIGVDELAGEDDEIARVRRASSRRRTTPPSCPRPAARRSRASSSATCAAAPASPESPDRG